MISTFQLSEPPSPCGAKFVQLSHFGVSMECRALAVTGGLEHRFRAISVIARSTLEIGGALERSWDPWKREPAAGDDFVVTASGADHRQDCC